MSTISFQKPDSYDYDQVARSDVVRLEQRISEQLREIRRLEREVRNQQSQIRSLESRLDSQRYKVDDHTNEIRRQGKEISRITSTIDLRHFATIIVLIGLAEIVFLIAIHLPHS